MIKRFSVTVVLFFVLTLSLFAGKADEKKLLALVPAAADSVLSVDLSAWFAMPAVKRGMAESPEIALLKKKTGLTPENIKALVFWGREGAWTLLVSADKPFDPVKFFAAPEYVCRKSVIEGADVYTVSSPKAATGKKQKRKRQNSFCVTVLPNNVTAFFQDTAQATTCLKLLKGKKGYAFPAAVEGTVRGVIGKGHGFEKAVISCAMTGAAKDVFSATFRVTLPTAQQAEEMRGQGMLMLNLLLIQSMKNAPELAADLAKQINFDVKDQDIIIKADLPAALIERLSKYAAQKKNSPKPRKPKAAPQKKTLPQSNK